MRAVVVYESMYGNTHTVAEAIAEGIAERIAEVLTVPVGRADDDVLAVSDLLVVGGPTHAWGMSRARTRAAAIERGTSSHATALLDATSTHLGLREWFDAQSTVPATMGAAFDTRRKGPRTFTGRAAPAIAARLGRWGCVSVAETESFLVDHDDHLIAGEPDRARAWGRHVAAAALEMTPASRHE